MPKNARTPAPSPAPRAPMTRDAASRITSAEARAGNGRVERGGFAARAESAAARNDNGRDR